MGVVKCFSTFTYDWFQTHAIFQPYIYKNRLLLGDKSVYRNVSEVINTFLPIHFLETAGFSQFSWIALTFWVTNIRLYLNNDGNLIEISTNQFFVRFFVTGEIFFSRQRCFGVHSTSYTNDRFSTFNFVVFDIIAYYK